MKKVLIPFALTAALSLPQSLTGIRSATVGASPSGTMPSRQVEVARPLLGYIADTANVLRPVVGSTTNAIWGDSLQLPDATTTVFLPPRQEYALLASDAGLSVARLSRTAIYPATLIANAMARPEQIAFSPAGEAAALFSSAENHIQVITYVAGKIHVLRTVTTAGAPALFRLAVSDDGELLAAVFANQPPVYSWQGANWRSLATVYSPDAWTFLPHTHDLVVSDQAQKAIALLPEAQRAPIAVRLLMEGAIAANLLSSNKEGTQLLAASSETSALWFIDLPGGAVTQLSGKEQIDSVTLLRDGKSFLVSSKGSPVVVQLSNGDVTPTATVVNSLR